MKSKQSKPWHILFRVLTLAGVCLFCFTAAVPLVQAEGAVLISETLEAVPYTNTNPTEAKRPTNPAVSYGLHVLAAREEMVFSGLRGNEITLTAEDICRAMNLSSLQYITITQLPDEDDGTLYVGSVGATQGQVISAGSISYLSFAAKDDEKPCEATVKLAVNGNAYDTTCRFRLIDVLNYTPTVSLAPEVSLTVETFADLKTSGTLSSYDPEGDELTYEIVRYASHGRVVLTDRHTGAYTYTPDSGYIGEDAFSYVVRDSYGNYSTSAVVHMVISAKPTTITYADVEEHPAAPSIIRVSLAGLMNGTQVGREQYFKPDEAVSRVEFLVTAMSAAGITYENVKTLSAPSFADTEDIPNSMAPYVSLAVQRGYVTGRDIASL
ncbi:MAG: hypothetical protein E7645_05795, partial [Ruminococcaceae bacterium]|nr:hypothetical protein [Oscillospiraceae bacterium]